MNRSGAGGNRGFGAPRRFSSGRWIGGRHEQARDLLAHHDTDILQLRGDGDQSVPSVLQQTTGHRFGLDQTTVDPIRQMAVKTEFVDASRHGPIEQWLMIGETEPGLGGDRMFGGLGEIAIIVSPAPATVSPKISSSAVRPASMQAMVLISQSCVCGRC